MKVKVSEATNIQLDWMVAKCLGEPEETLDPTTWVYTAYVTRCYLYSSVWE